MSEHPSASQHPRWPRPRGTTATLLAITAAALGGLLAWASGAPPAPSERAGARTASERAALDWWQRLRSRDAPGVLALMTRQSRAFVPRARLERALRGPLGVILADTRATVIASYGERGRAIVVLQLEHRPPRTPVTDLGVDVIGVAVQRERGRLRVASSSWLRRRIGLDPLAEAAARGEAERGGQDRASMRDPTDASRGGRA